MLNWALFLFLRTFLCLSLVLINVRLKLTGFFIK